MGTILFILLGTIFYFIPSVIAFDKKKKNAVAIFAVNLLLGWIIIGWILALIWALSNDEKKQVVPTQTKSDADDLQKLSDLKERGIISEDEFNAKKKQVLSMSKFNEDEFGVEKKRVLSTNRQRKSVIILLGFLVIVFLFFNAFGEGDLPNRSSVPVAQQDAETSEVYTMNQSKLESSIIDQENGITMIDVQYALARLTEFQVFEYPFYAMKNQKGKGYIGIVDTDIGKAIFVVPSIALNQTSKSALEVSIKAVNGTAKELNRNVAFAAGYDYIEVMSWVE